ncbi:helix-turn-helix domain-containing protein [Rathayibacter sp. VKM Ac-2856]|uniref:PucR family transcriptional regulator n=1 Tax=Rathayibacter TaxID=33886 RepID=UPI001564CA66|nr:MULTISPECIES: helix-turn-helix domain-containing protein [Rathayibacter]MDY0912476.1 helix-turn-helix domain-containing protein [Rathayibacter festucae]NQX03773.1 helix-turn-helix domain-containing protein [Rathayibacter sp. VKM Ac-2858]NQX18941.1 helix-turn-helix domain-containing protein [Rathayibacter sp. VKM Ac-2856]NRG39611.1 helix-turn-helix domain-containing protein [Rathayibacter sp. VKM Ac-2835]
MRTLSGELSTQTIKKLEDTLPWYGSMPPGRRSAVGMVAQAGITSFISWFDDPSATPWIAADVFGAAPRELLRSVSLTQTLQLIKVTVEVVEERITNRGEDLREAILLYSREIAFAAADVYARAAEARGLWDARLEALVVDSILTGEADDELPSRIAALGWHGHGEVAVLVGTAPKMLDVDQLRRTARHMSADVLIGVQGSRLVLVIGRAEPSENATEETGPPVAFLEIANALEPGFGSGHLVLGHEVPTLVEASRSARAALAGFAVARSWRNAPRPVNADDLLPERALAGDPLARQSLITQIYKPLQKHSTELLTTLWAYLDNGRSLEATARELFVHPNTVRYRLKRVAEVIGWDATGAREALILQSALILGSMSDPDGAVRRRPTRK